jgi:RHS repeat-associated protein
MSSATARSPVKKVQCAATHRYVGAYGVRWDADTGLHYMRARWYDGGLQRFVGRDRVGSANRYAYARNRPNALVDANGLYPLTPQQYQQVQAAIQEIAKIDPTVAGGLEGSLRAGQITASWVQRGLSGATTYGEEISITDTSLNDSFGYLIATLYHEYQHVLQFRSGRWLKCEGALAHGVGNPYAKYELEYDPYVSEAAFAAGLARYERTHGNPGLAAELLSQAKWAQDQANQLIKNIELWQEAQRK